MTKRTQITENTYTVGHNNVFVDLGFPEEEATELKIKAYLFHYLLLAVKKELRKNTQAQLAKKLGVSQPLISKIVNDDFDIFSVERIAHLLLKLNYDIYVGVKPASKKNKAQVATLYPLLSPY